MAAVHVVPGNSHLTDTFVTNMTGSRSQPNAVIAQLWLMALGCHSSVRVLCWE